MDESKNISEILMERFEISQYKDVKSMNLSGGNQRKVCTAISLIGRPKVISPKCIYPHNVCAMAVHTDGRADQRHGPGEQEPGAGAHQGGGEERPERPHDLTQYG